MKSKLLAILFVCTLSVQGQMLYKLTNSTGTYVPIVGGTDISVAAWDSAHTVILPFAFKFFGKQFNNVMITSDGLYFTDTGMDYIYYSSDDIIPEKMDYKKSKIKFDIVGNVGDRILVAEYNNIREWNATDTALKYIIYNQIRLYEKGDRIQYHFGPSKITDPQFTEFYIGVLDTDGDPIYGIDGTASSPVLADGDGMSFNGIASYPVNGQIYTLSPINGASLSKIEKTYFFATQQKGFTVRSNDAMTIDLMDASGKKVQSYQYTQTHSLQTIEPNLGAGIYFLNITIGNQNFIEKILLY
jgi:hypothetical protein